jgi:predicted N-formylglutamate amidohydrolase
MVVDLQRTGAAAPQPDLPEQSGEAPPKEPALAGGFVITVPHASGDVPDWLNPLTAAVEWQHAVAGTHHALDRGAQALARALGLRLSAPVIEGAWSRLFIDLNRPIDDPSAIIAGIDGRALVFNQAIAPGDLASRRSAHRRYHQQVATFIAGAAKAGPLFLVDQHSFDRHGPAPAAHAVDIGVCAPGDDLFARHLLTALLARTTAHRPDAPAAPRARILNARLNEPYSADHPGAYILRRYLPAATAGAVIEVCDDILADDGDVAAVADLLAESLAAAARAMAAPAPPAPTPATGDCA